MPSQLLNPDPGWQELREAVDLVTVCDLEGKAVKWWFSSDLETGDVLDFKLELQGGGYRCRESS